MRKELRLYLLLLVVIAVADVCADDTSIDEIVVTATRRATSAADVSSPISHIDRESAWSRKLVTDALASNIGVSLQQTTPGQGAAIVRGLKGSAVLHMVDGIRLNNAIFRSAPTQYFALVPTTAVERIEVIRGTPASLYGSDAVGGVVQVVTHVPAFDGATVETRGEALVAYDTAELGKSIRSRFDAGNRRIAGTLGLEYLQTGDRRVGGGERIVPSAFDSRALRFALSATPEDETAWLFDLHWLQQPATPRVDELVPGYGETEPSSSEYLFKPNERIFVHGRHTRENGWLGLDWNFDLAWQRIVDDRESRAFQSALRQTEKNNSELASAVVSASKFTESGSWVLGAELYADRVGSSRTEIDIQDGLSTSVASRFPDGSSIRQASLFGNVDRRISSRHALNGGLRISSFAIDLPATVASTNASIDLNDLSGDVGWVFDLTDSWQLMANGGAGFRAPNVFDLGTLGERPGNRFNIPNTDLDAEHVLQLDAGIRRRSDRLQFEVVFYSMRYTDRIVTVTTGDVTADGREVVQSTNAAEAEIRGIESGLDVQLTEVFSLTALLNYTYGTQQFDDGASEPGDRIPPLSGSANFNYESGSYGANAWLTYAAAQDRLSARDVGDARIDPTGTAGWGIIGVQAWFADSERFALTLGLDNILDKRYRVHGSGLDAPGRSFSVSLRATW